MPPLSLLIKPSSGLCDLGCRYCFYDDISGKREQKSYGFMADTTLEKVVYKALKYAEGSCDFGFQGGEPTLIGLDFYRRVVELQQHYNYKNLVITNTIQTNGYKMNAEWAGFLAEHHFLVGISVDGIKQTHDHYRKTASGQGTFEEIMKATALLQEYQVEFNILTVVHRDTAKQVEQIYHFYRQQGFFYLQFIPCLDPIGETPGQREYSLTPKLYGEFLCRLFDLWYADLIQGKGIYIRQFENYICMLLGGSVESCDMNGFCQLQHVVEAGGNVYPCDFYVLDQYVLGNIHEKGFDNFRQRFNEIGFYQESAAYPQTCHSCEFFRLCRNGCKRCRGNIDTGGYAVNYFCPAYQQFFRYCGGRLMEIAENIARHR